MTQIATDTFNRPDQNPISGNWTSVPLVGNITGFPRIVSAAATGSATGNFYSIAFWNANVFPNDQYSEMSYTSIGRFNGVAVRTTSGGNCYIAIQDNGSHVLYILKITAGIAAVITSTTFTTLFVGDVLRLEVLGTNLTAKVNGAVILTAVDPTFASGSAGMFFDNEGGAPSISQYWAGGDFSTTASISGNAGTPGATVTWSGTSSGSTVADGAGNYLISGLINGSYTITPSLVNFTFSPVNANETISGASISGVNFIATFFSPAYSVPDDRNYGNFPNLPLNVQGTLTYTTPSVFSLRYWFDTLFNRTQPLPLDSRVAIPVDSRTAGNIPLNSRTPGTFGPNE